MKVLCMAGIVLLSVMLETAVLPNMTILGVAPDFLLCIVVSFALLDGSLFGALTGAAAGLLIDIACGSILGFYALQYVIVGYLAGIPYKRMQVGRFFLPPIMAAVLYAVKTALLSILLFVTGSGVHIAAMWLYYVALGTLLTTILMLPVHLLNARLHMTRLFRTRKNRDVGAYF
ncbi:MAG: rod shape-determining protein MreD [Christensenellales bacterium]|jgi:rod shape-determining protein MreD